MMGINKRFFFILLISIVFSLSCVSASDNNSNSTNYLSLSHNHDLNELIINNNENSNLNSLSDEINNADNELTLTKDYSYQSGDESINLSKNFKLNGNGYTIDIGNLSYAFNINNTVHYNIVLSNIIFKNCDSLFNMNQASITIINCDIFDKSTTALINSSDAFINPNLHNSSDTDKLTFDDLNNEIYYSNGFLNLTDNYYFFSNNEFIKLYKNLILNGNGNFIDAGNSDYVFEINTNTDYNIVLIDIVFENFNNIFNTLDTQLTIIDCDFSDANDDGEYSVSIKSYEDFIKGYATVVPSEKIISKAKSIVGSYTGIDAAKKLAKWIKKNIKHESLAGFYQSPDDTLSRKKGNCCSQTELFLLMCKAVGIDKECELKFVHVGNMKFKQRHFFALIDNICVDVDSGYDNPWAHGGFSKRSVFSITEYPLLPLAKDY